LVFLDFCLVFYIFYLNFREMPKKTKNKLLFGFPRFLFGFPRHPFTTIATKSNELKLKLLKGVTPFIFIHF
jgi:hypothetical protein